MILTNRFDPDVRVYKEAKYLVEKGHEVEILAWDREHQYLNEDKKNYNGIKVTRFYPFSKYGSGSKQIIPYIKFIREIRSYLKRAKYDFLHCHDLDGALAGLFVKKKYKKFIFDMHEYYEIQGRKKKIRLLIRLLVNYIQNKSDNIIYVLDEQIDKMKVNNKKKLIYLPNYPEVNNYIISDRHSKSTLYISYIGAVRQYQELMNLMLASKDQKNIQVQINGDGVAYEALNKESSHFDNVIVTGRYEYSDSKELFNHTDVLYAVYPNSNLQYRVALPVKLFEAIASGTPLIVSRNTKLEEFVEKYDIGFSIDPESVEQLQNLLIDLTENRELLEYKKKNIEKIRYKFRWENVVNALDQIY